MRSLFVSAFQGDFTVGAIEENAAKCLEAMNEAEKSRSDVLILPELALTGYPPEDLLLNPAFIDANLEALDRVVKASKGKKVTTLIGFVDRTEGTFIKGIDSYERELFNAVAIVNNGRKLAVVHKTLLPTYSVFDEARYFLPSTQKPQVFVLPNDVRFGVPICEDLWRPGVADELVAAGAEILLVPNASPYHKGKNRIREKLVKDTALRVKAPVVYLASVGGQDELVFDGGSCVSDSKGNVIMRAGSFEEEFLNFEIDLERESLNQGAPLRAFMEENEEIYLALVKGLEAYVKKNNFKSVVLGLSGGIDSALVATIAADALGADALWGVGMPGPYSSGGSVTDAQELARRLECRFDVLSIKHLYESELKELHGSEEAPGPFAGTTFNTAEENMQARLRMTFLMSISNKHGNLLLTTGNKSETSVGYCTLYGDAAGGFAPIKDVYKTLVFDLCQWRNTLNKEKLQELHLLGGLNPIPEETIAKPPSAELAPDQRDDQSLPPYFVLDGILERYIERRMSVQEIIEHGFNADVVARVARLVDVNEYKRRQAPPGVKITHISFGRDRRLPITNKWRQRAGLEKESFEESSFPSRAEVEAILSVKMNALGISAWWDTENANIKGMTPSEAFKKAPQEVVNLAKKEVS